MAKPICLIHYSDALLINTTTIQAQLVLSKKLPDYHVFAFPSKEEETMSVQVFYEKDFTEIDREELLKKIENELKEYKHD